MRGSLWGGAGLCRAASGSSLGYRWGYHGMSRGYPWANRGAIVWMRGIALAILWACGRVRLPFVVVVGRGPCWAIVGYAVAILWLSQGYLPIHHG